MTKDEVATRAECWMCSYCPVLASGKRGPATEGMLTVQIGTPNLTLHTHPRGEPLARHPKPARPIDHGFYVEMGDYVVQALRPASDIDGGQNPAFDAAFLYPGQVLPPHLTRNMQQHAHARQHEEEDEWDALLSWFGLGGGGDDERDALPAPKRYRFEPGRVDVVPGDSPARAPRLGRRVTAGCAPGPAAAAAQGGPVRAPTPDVLGARRQRTRGWSTSHRPRTTTCVRRSAIGRVGHERY